MTTKSYWKGSENYSEYYSSYPPKKETFEPCLDLLLEGENFQHKIILDAGCGLGHQMKKLSGLGGELYGVDIEFIQAKRSQKIAWDTVAVADVRKLPFNDHFFDCVTSFMVLITFEEYEKAISEVKGVLKPGGNLYFAIVNPESEIWDLNTRKCHHDLSKYNQIEVRPWVINLKNGRSEIWNYFHRPWEHYQNTFKKFDFLLDEEKIYKPVFPIEKTDNGLYATKEYLLAKAIME